MHAPFAAAAALLVACSGGAPQPAEIVFDEDACSVCRMTISEPRYAAQFVARGGAVERFDDLGCLAAWRAGGGRQADGAAFVADWNGDGWLHAEEVLYLLSPRLPTPMRYGLAAFADRAAAAAAAAELGGGEVVTWDELLARGVAAPGDRR